MEIYILSSGEEVDLTNYSESQKILFLADNVGAKLKKVKGVAPGAIATPQRTDMFAPKTEDTVSSSEIVSLDTPQDLGVDNYGLPVTESSNLLMDSLQKQFGDPSSGAQNSTNKLERTNIGIPEFDVFTDVNVQNAVDKGFITQDELNLAGYIEPTGPQSTMQTISDPILRRKQNDAKRKISSFQSLTSDKIDAYIDMQKLNEPYIYLNETQKAQGDDPLAPTVVSEVYNDNDFGNTNINPNDFNGFLIKRGFDKDIERYIELGLNENVIGTSTDAATAFEAKKLQYLNMYINDQIQRDIKQQKLEYERETGVDPDGINKTFSLSEGNINLNSYKDYIKKEFPLITEKMELIDMKDQMEYQNLVSNKGNISAGRFLTNVLGNGWTGFSDAVNSFSASAYGILPGDYFEGVSESIRVQLLMEEVEAGSIGRYVTAIGNSYVDKESGIKYIVDQNGRIIDTTNSLDATNFLDAYKSDKIRTEARKNQRKDSSFSTLGAFDAGANVIGDLFFQIALTRGMGNSARAIGGFTKGLGVLGKTKKFLRSIPIKQGMADAIIGQSTLGFSKGYEETLKQARAAGINDEEASRLATIASVQTGILYAATAPLSPQMKATDAIFGKIKNDYIKVALREYAKKGVAGFVNKLQAVGKGLFNLQGEGLKEVFQENVQQSGETFIVNKNVNDAAGQLLMKDTMSLQDFYDTTILSFFAGAIMPGAGVSLNLAKRSARNILGMSNVDRFNALSVLAAKDTKVKKILAQQVDQGVYTQEQANQILEEVKAYNDNINSMPTDLSADTATEILGDLNEVGKLTIKRKTEAKAFQATTDERIKTLNSKIQNAYYSDIASKKSAVIAKAIKSGVVKNISWNEFDADTDTDTGTTATQKIVDFLVNELNFTKEQALQKAENYGAVLLKDGKGNILADKVVIINNELAAKDGRVTTKQHEFLHNLIFETIKNDPEAQSLLGRSLLAEVLKIQDTIDLEKEGTALPDEFLNNFNNYINFYAKQMEKVDAELARGDISSVEHENKINQNIGNQWEEVLTLYSEAIEVGAVRYDEDSFTKLADMWRQVLQFLGVKDVEFSSGKAVYNFIKDYNKSMNNRVMSLDKNKAFKKLGTEGAKIDREALREDAKKVSSKRVKRDSEILSEIDEKGPTDDELKDIEDNYTFDDKFAIRPKARTTSDEFQTKINSYFNKNKWGKKDGPDTVLYEILNDYETIILSKAYTLYGQLPDYSSEDMLSETQIALIPHIRNFNKSFLKLREEKRASLIESGLTSNEVNNALNNLDVKGYKNADGKIVKENNNLNGWINSQLRNKFKDALKSGNVTSERFTDEINDNVASTVFEADNDILIEEEQKFEEDQNNLVQLLKNPIFGFNNSDGEPILIEGVTVGGSFPLDSTDPTVAANQKMKTVTDPAAKAELEQQLRDLKRGLELESKSPLTSDEMSELKALKSFWTYSLSSGGMIKTYQALSQEINPAAVIVAEVKREIANAPNIETLNFRNFKRKLAITSQTLSRRMTFQNKTELKSFMFNNWEMIWNVINNPIDPVTGQSTYAIKKLPPRLKSTNDVGLPIKTKNINIATFLQSYFGIEESTKIIEDFSKNPNVLLNKFDPVEISETTGNKLGQTTLFDRRTALMELFGDVLVLQEARKAMRDDSFIEKIGKRNIDLYNQLKSDETRNKIINDFAIGKSPSVKFSLKNGSLNNSKISTYLKNTNNNAEQFFIAEILDNATRQAIKYNRPAVKFNVPDLGNMNDKAISYYLIDKISQGYNDFYFKNNNNWKNKLSRSVIETGDIKFSLNNKRNSYSKNLSTGLNEIIEDNSSLDASEIISAGRAKNMGAKIGKWNKWLPPGDSDFLGLMYMIASGRGKKGEAQLKYLNDALITPYADGVLNMVDARNIAHRDWKNLITKEHKGIKKKLSSDSGYEGFSIDQAIRVYLFKKAGYEVPGLDNKDIFNLSNIVRTNPALRRFAIDVSILSKQENGYIEPDENWQQGTIILDIQNILSNANRKKYLEKFLQNKDLIFSKDNINKLKATLGDNFVIALEDILYRMQTGRNRPGDKSTLSSFNNWINGSIGVTMFFNMKSALLQTISATNFINTSDNNIVAATRAFANQPQFWKDFKTLYTSSYLTDRRSGVFSDLQESELVDLFNNAKSKTLFDKGAKGVFWLLKKGFLPTRAADSLAIAMGGASFYRNRIKSLMKEQAVDKELTKKNRKITYGNKYTLEQAQEIAMRDFYKTAEASQQSADPSKISKNQASIAGRLILAFQNTPLQYGRLIKNGVVDIVKGRGDLKNNVAKVSYYAAMQNIVFNFLQNGLFSMWDDDDPYADIKGKYKVPKSRAINGAIDTLLRGSGLYGSILSAIKNTSLKAYELYNDPKGRYKKSELLVEMLNVSPPVGIKARKFMTAWSAITYNQKEADYLGWSLDNPYYMQAGASLTSGILNIPLDRLYIKVENLKGVMNSDYKNWQRTAMFMGFNKRSLGIEDAKANNQGLDFDLDLDLGIDLELPTLKF